MSARRTVATSLAYRLRPLIPGKRGKRGVSDFAAVWGREAERELRALLAVARDHDRLLTYAAGWIAGTGTIKRDIWEEHPVLARSLKLRDRLARASTVESGAKLPANSRRKSGGGR